MGIVNLLGGNVATIGSQFHYVLADGTQGNGIPQLLPQLMLPWSLRLRFHAKLGFTARAAASGLLDGNAGGNRIIALRRRAGRHDRHQT